jgi:hypothetical protein
MGRNMNGVCRDLTGVMGLRINLRIICGLEI